MVPWGEVIKVKADDAPAVLWDLAERTSVSRFPVIEGGAVIGVVSLYDALQHDRAACPPIRQLARPAMRLDAGMPLRPALMQLQTGHAAMAIVTERDKPLGVVTVKDLVEPITGELASW
jgi:putative hemolysin